MNRRAEPGEPVCEAGRTADWGGRWLVPCPNVGDNKLGFGDETTLTDEMRFCEMHVEQLIVAGLVTDPYMDPADYARKRRA